MTAVMPVAAFTASPVAIASGQKSQWTPRGVRGNWKLVLNAQVRVTS